MINCLQIESLEDERNRFSEENMQLKKTLFEEQQKIIDNLIHLDELQKTVEKEKVILYLKFNLFPADYNTEHMFLYC